MYDELLDLVNEQDEVIGQKYRSEIWKDEINNFRTINGFLMNDNQDIWIPRRSPNKQLFPLCLDSSVGGHVMAGESYEQAFFRELKEELSIDHANTSHYLIAKLNPTEHKTSSYTQVYLIISNVMPQYSQDDFIDYNWISPKDLLKKITRGKLVKSDLLLLTHVLLNWLQTR